MMKLGIIVVLLLMSTNTYAADVDSVMTEFKVFTDFSINVARLVGFILFGASIYTLKKRADNPNQYPLSMAVYGMISGVFLQIAGFIYTMFYNTMLGVGETPTNKFLALDISSLNALTGGSAQHSLLGKMVPAETMSMVLAVLYFVGAVSFLKGIYLIKDMGQPNTAGGSSSGKLVIVHMGAGLVAMHVTFFGCMLEASFGFGLMCTTS